MNLFSSQIAKFPAFASLLHKELLLFVQGNPTVFNALLHYGMYPPASAVRLWASAASLASHTASARHEQRHLLLRTLGAGTDPQVMLMTSSTAGGGSDWLGFYNAATGYITIYKPLIETWEALEASRKTLTQEKEGYRIILRRNTIALMLHELVHFLNDQAFPKQPINTEPDHLSRFARDAFGPLGWERADYEGLQGSWSSPA